MLESPTSACANPTATGSSMTTHQHQQMAQRSKIENGDFAEEYFASLSGPAKRLIEDVVAVKESYEDVWTGLNASEQEELLNESLIRPEAILKYENRQVEIRKSSSSRHPASASTAEVRLSSFGVDKVYPRLKIQSGQKDTTFEDTTGSQGEDFGSDCTYSYRDEHSAPWSWMTRSQQELSFESGPHEYIEEELDGLETLTTASPSRALNRQSLLVRHSKGNPLFAKPVGIPVVPNLEHKDLVKMDPRPPVSPHKINNFVYEEDNRIILDFGSDDVQQTNIDNALRGHSPNHSESSKSTSSLLAKMKEKRNTLKKSLSNVSNAGTLRRKKSQSFTNGNVKNSSSSPSSTLSSTMSQSSMTSMKSTASTVVIKPSTAPPPPPPPSSQVSKPTTAPPPPPPPVRTTTTQIQTQNREDDVVKPLEEFKIDLNTESDIPKTGFDFLDNW